MGSVTTTILPRAETPVLVIHPPEDDIVPETTFQNLVIPLDMSERSEDVLPQAIEFAEALSLDTTLVTCIPSALQLYIGAVPEVYPYPDDLMQSRLRSLLRSTCKAPLPSSRKDAKFVCSGSRLKGGGRERDCGIRRGAAEQSHCDVHARANRLRPLGIGERNGRCYPGWEHARVGRSARRGWLKIKCFE